MNNLFYIVSRLTKIKSTREEDQLIANYLKSIGDNQNEQDKFYTYCFKWKLAPWCYVQLNKKNLFSILSTKTQGDFNTIYEKVKQENEDRITEAVLFLKEFQKEDINIVILKGNLFIHNVYHDFGYKKMNDFDILIHYKDWEKAQNIYIKLGYIPLGFGWEGEKQKAVKYSHTGMSFISKNYKCIIGTQWGLKSPTSKYSLNNDEIWDAAIDFELQGIQVKQLSAEYNLLHLILHMGVYKCGIRDLMDVYNLLESVKIKEDLFYQIAKESNAIDKSYFTLKLANLCADTINTDFIERFKPLNNSFLNKRLKAKLRLMSKSNDFQLSYNDCFHDVEMSVFYFSLFPYFHHKFYHYAMVFKTMLFPNKALAYKLSDLSTQASVWAKLKARLKAPYYIFSLIGEEIGLKITILLFIKLFISLILSIKNYFFKKDSYFDYLKKRNINPNDIKKAVKNLQ